MKLYDYLRLIRYKNLLIIILTQYLMRYCVIWPFLHSINLDLQFSDLHFAFLVISTVLIAAAGYAINDYFDTRVDMMNHPDSVVVGTKISRRKAMLINNLFNFVGVALGFYISWRINLINLGFVFVLISGGLWFYSALYKRQFLIGNIMVALFTAIVPFLVAVYEIPLLNEVITPGRPPVEHKAVSIIFLYIAGYAFFAFFTTLAREIVKDIEDIEGDSQHGRKTVPVKLGIKTAKGIVATLIILTAAAVVYIWSQYFLDITSLAYLGAFVVLPMLYLTWTILIAKQKAQYRRVSIGMKWIMLAGLLYSVLLLFIVE